MVILTWVVLGQFGPSIVAVLWAVLTFLLILRTGDSSKVLIAFVAVLILSDSRLPMMQFAATAKIGFIISLAGYLVVGNKRVKVENEIFKYFLPFALFALFTTLWAKDHFISLQKSVSYGLLLFSLPAIFLMAWKRNRAIVSDLIFFVSILLGIGLALYLISPNTVLLVERYRGLLGNPNGLGILLTASGPLFFLSMRSKAECRMNRTSQIIFLLVFVMSLLLSGSRTSLFAVMIFLAFYAMRNLPHALTFTLFLVISISYDAILSSLPQISIFFGLQEYLRVDTLDEGSGRFVAWNFAFDKIESVFFLGGGYGYTELIFKKFFWELSNLGHQGNAHNSYLTLWLDTGLIGLSLFVVGMVRTSLSALNNSRYALPIIYCMLFSANFESWLAASLNPFTSLFLILITILLIKEDNEAKDQMASENKVEIQPASDA